MSDNISGPNYTETATQSETLIRLTVHRFFCLKVFFSSIRCCHWGHIQTYLTGFCNHTEIGHSNAFNHPPSFFSSLDLVFYQCFFFFFFAFFPNIFPSPVCFLMMFLRFQFCFFFPGTLQKSILIYLTQQLSRMLWSLNVSKKENNHDVAFKCRVKSLCF